MATEQDVEELAKIGQLIRVSSYVSVETPTDWQPHQLRVVIEANELLKKANALQKFVLSPTRPDLPAAELQLLMAQHGLMTAYHEVLFARMRLWGLPA